MVMCKMLSFAVIPSMILPIEFRYRRLARKRAKNLLRRGFLVIVPINRGIPVTFANKVTLETYKHPHACHVPQVR